MVEQERNIYFSSNKYNFDLSKRRSAWNWNDKLGDSSVEIRIFNVLTYRKRRQKILEKNSIIHRENVRTVICSIFFK